MTDEEINRKFDVVAGHLATVAVGLQQMQEAQARAEAASAARLSRLESVVKLAVRAGVRTRREVREQLSALIDAQIRTDGALAKLAEAQAHTDQRLDALIDIVQGGRHGNGGNSDQR